MSEGRENIDLLALALAYRRAPLDHQERLAAIATLPEDMNRLLRLASGAAEALAAAARQTGAAASEIRGAALFLLQQLCFTRDAGHYRVLGLNPDATAEQIKDHHRLLMRLVHPDRAGAADCWVDGYAARINEAYSVLSRPQRRAAYDGSLARGEPIAARVPAVARSRSTAWREAPRRRRSRLAPRAHLPVLVLGGAALVAVLGVAVVYLLAKPPIMATAESVATTEERSSMAMPTGGDALAAFQARPDWRALEQIEREASARASRIHAVREQLETDHQNQLRIEQAELERLREERALLEQQLRATRLEVERRRLEQLRAEQDETERLRTERLNAERRKLEQLRAEQAQAEKLAEEARAERRKLEQLRVEQARTEKLAEEARAERRKLEQLRVERIQAEKRTEQARKERVQILARVEQAPRRPSREVTVHPPLPPAGEGPGVRVAESTPYPLTVALSPMNGGEGTERLPRQLPPLKAEQGPLESPERAERQTTARELTTRELDILIDHYAGAYQSGDLDRLMALFDARARGGSGQDRDRLRRDYADFFGATQSRRLSLNPVRWTPRGSTATGVTHYRLRAVQSDGSTRDYEGGIRFEVSRQEARVLIRGIDFDIRRLQ